MKILSKKDFSNTPILTIALVTVLSFTSISTLSNANGIDIPTQEKVEVIQRTVSLNDSTLDELITLKGVGKKKAQAILAYRKLYGDFKTIEELVDVKGIGNKILNENKSRLKI